MGKFGDNGVFVATNATNFPQGTLNGTLSAGISNSEECTTDAYGKALKYSLKEPVAFTINELGMIEGVNENGWFNQTIRELEGNSTLPISLTELINGWAELMMNGLTEPELFNGVSMDYGLAVYVLGADEELLGCANIKILDKDTSAEYDKLIFGFSQEAVEEVPSSARKNGLFVFVSAVAAVGIAFVLGDILAL